jgi:hypothetical protein
VSSSLLAQTNKAISSKKRKRLENILVENEVKNTVIMLA